MKTLMSLIVLGLVSYTGIAQAQPSSKAELCSEIAFEASSKSSLGAATVKAADTLQAKIKKSIDQNVKGCADVVDLDEDGAKVCKAVKEYRALVNAQKAETDLLVTIQTTCLEKLQ
jgi:hypothetical protein